MAGYSRQSAASIVPTAVVRATPLNDEFNALRDAFVVATGHKHDGTSTEGAYIPLVSDTNARNKVVVDSANNRISLFINVSSAAVEQLRLIDGAILPVTDNDIDLGSSSFEFKDLFIDGTANIDSLVADTAAISGGTINSTVIGGTTPAAGTFTTVSATVSATIPSATISGGTINNTIIGATTPAAGTFTNLTVNTAATIASAAISAGTINNTVIGGTTPQAITGTTITANTGFVGALTGNVTGNVTASSGTSTFNNATVNGTLSATLTGNVNASSGTSTFNNVTISGTLNMDGATAATITNLSSPVNNSDAATKLYVDTSISNLVNSAPGTLDTLNELASALGNDPSFATTVTNSIATKLSLSGGTMTGAIAMGTNKITGMGDPTNAQDAATKTYVDTQRDTRLALSGGTMSGAIAMGTNKITGLGDPTSNQDAATKIYVDGILGSATSAAASAAAAATSASNAATSASNASTSATNAAASASAAAASYDSFDDRYLGAKSSDPTLDNDGNALLTGALYWNTTAGEMRVYSGTAWVPSYLTTGAQTITGVKTFASNPILDAGTANGVAYLNGSKVLTTGSALTFDGTNLGVGVTPTANQGRIQANGAGQSWFKFYDSSAGWNFGTFYKANGTTALAYLGSGGGNAIAGATVDDFVVRAEGNLVFTAGGGTEAMRLTSTGLGIGTSSPNSRIEAYSSTASSGTPIVVATLTSYSGVVNGNGAALLFRGQSNAGVYSAAQISSRLTDGTPSAEKASLTFSTVRSGTITEAMTLDASGNLLLGTSTSSGSGNRITVYDNSNSGQIALCRDAGGQRGTLLFGRLNGGTFQETARIGNDSDPASPNNGILYFYTSNSSGVSTERARITSTGDLLVGTTSNAESARLNVQGNYAFFRENASGADVYIRGYYGNANVAAIQVVSNSPLAFATNNTERARITSTGDVGIGTSSPAAKLHVAGTVIIANAGPTNELTFTGTDYTNIYSETTGGMQIGINSTGNSASVEFLTNNAERFRIGPAGQIGLSGANYGTSGQVLTSNGSGSAPTWQTVGGGSAATPTALGTVYGSTQDISGTANTVLGYQGLNANTTGNSNVVVGVRALQANTTGSRLTALGYSALNASTTSSDNTAVGSLALLSNTTGNYNTAIGSNALRLNTTASYNTAVGYEAGYSNTTGLITAVGAQALNSNTTGAYNVAVGGYTAGSNYAALTFNTTGSNNTAVGIGALQANTTASNNTAVGYQAAYSNTTGYSNVAVGRGAVYYNTTGYSTVAVGAYALEAQTTGFYNTALGHVAGDKLTTGAYNVIIGAEAARSAGSNLTTGQYNTIIGCYSGTSASNGQKQIVIGYNVAGQADANVTIGSSSGKIYNAFESNATWTQTSDGTMKNVVGPDTLGLSFINRLNPIKFTWKAQNELPADHPYYNEVNSKDTTTVIHGFVAQEVKAALDAEGCTTFNGWDQGPDGIQAISREMFISPLVKAVQELSAQVEQLKAEIATLKGA